MYLTAIGWSLALPILAAAQSTCPVTTVEVQLLFYSEVFQYTTIIDPFRNEGLLTVSLAPTTVVLTSTTLFTILPQIPSIDFASPTSPPTTAAVISVKTTTKVASVTSTTFGAAASTDSPGLYIGQGLPLGRVQDLPDQSFVFIAVSATAMPQPKALRIRDATASPVSIVNLAQATGALSPGFCDQSSPLLLRNGTLAQLGKTISKNEGTDAALLGILYSETASSVNSIFSIVDGVLHWRAADLGTEATFYECEGSLQVGFGRIPDPDCNPVRIGLIAGRACQNYVASTRAVEPTFTAPLLASESISLVSSDSSYSAPSSNGELLSVEAVSTTEVNPGTPEVTPTTSILDQPVLSSATIDPASPQISSTMENPPALSSTISISPPVSESTASTPVSSPSSSAASLPPLLVLSSSSSPTIAPTTSATAIDSILSSSPISSVHEIISGNDISPYQCLRIDCHHISRSFILLGYHRVVK